MASLAGKTLAVAPPKPARPVRAAPATAPDAAPDAAAAVEAPAAAEVEPSEVEVAPEVDVEPAPARTERTASRVQKSVEIERRAEEAKRRARAEGQRAQERKAQADERVRQADRRAKDADRREEQINSQMNALQQEIRLLKTAPLDFARTHGVSGKEIADYVRSGSDPTARRLDMLETEMGQRLASAEKAYEKKLSQLAEGLRAERLQASNEEFVSYVSSDLDRFEATNVIYSPDEILFEAEKLAKKNARLNLGWDGDRLCEELESLARKDPRWGRMQARFERRPKKPTTPNDTDRTPPNARTTDATERAAPEREQRQRPTRARTAQEPTGTPASRHRNRLNRFLRNAVIR